MTRKSFIIHHDSLDILDEMTDEQAGQLFKAIKNYQNENVYDEMDLVIKMAFIPFKNQFERDNQKYEKICVRNRTNGEKGGRPEGTAKTQPNPQKPKATQKTQSVIPEFEEFKQYANSNAENIDEEKLLLKYKSWAENGWNDGHNKPIKNWRTKLLNTLQYLKNDKGNNRTGSSERTSATYSRSEAIDTAQTLFSGGNREPED